MHCHKALLWLNNAQVSPELGAWGPVVAACTRLNPAQRCTLRALADYLASNATALGAKLGGDPAASPAPAGGVQGPDPIASPLLAVGALGACADAAGAVGIAPACNPDAHQAHAAQMLWGGAWGGMAGLPFQAAGDSAAHLCAHSTPCEDPGVRPEAATLPLPSNTAAMLRSGSGAGFSAAVPQITPVEPAVMGCTGLGAGGTWEQPAAHPGSAGWSPGCGVPPQPLEPEGGRYPCIVGWSAWGGAPAQPHASGMELEGRGHSCSAGWGPWAGTPSPPLASGAAQELGCGAHPCGAVWSPWCGAVLQPQLGGEPGAGSSGMQRR